MQLGDISRIDRFEYIKIQLGSFTFFCFNFIYSDSTTNRSSKIHFKSSVKHTHVTAHYSLLKINKKKKTKGKTKNNDLYINLSDRYRQCTTPIFAFLFLTIRFVQTIYGIGIHTKYKLEISKTTKSLGDVQFSHFIIKSLWFLHVLCEKGQLKLL